MFLSDIPTAPPVNPAFLMPPPISSVTNISQPPTTFTVRLPSLDTPPTLSKTEIAALAGAVLLALWTMRGGRR